jgi:hypothetical protein
LTGFGEDIKKEKKKNRVSIQRGSNTKGIDLEIPIGNNYRKKYQVLYVRE